MSETLRDLVVSLSLQTDNFTRNIRSVNKHIAEAESKFKLAAAGVEGFEKTAAGLSTQLSTLERRLSLQKDAVTQYERALTAANGKLQECFTRQTDYAQRLTDARTAQQALKEQVAAAAQQVRVFSQTLGENDSATITAKANLDALKTEYRASVQEVKKLAGQNTALQKSAQNAADAVSTASTNLNKARAAVKTTQAEIDKCNQALRLAQTNWEAAGKAIEDSRAAITTFGKQISLAESRFKLATVRIKELDTSITGLSAKLTLLNEKLALQQQSVAQYENALRGAREQLIAAQQANDPEKIRQASDAVIDAEAALNRAKAAVASTRAEIEQTNKQLASARSAWTAAGKELEAFGKKCETVSRTLTAAGRTLSTAMTAPILSLGAAAIKASVSYESAFASVRKTVDATEAQYDSLSSEIKQMSTEIATSADDIAEVVAIAGQLGIETDYLTEFARTMIDLGNSTDIVADEAASVLAKFANITGMNQSEFDNLGASLVDLGNNCATTESAIMNMAMRLAAAGTQVGLSESQILGFAAALSSVGIEAEMGGSAFSKALVNMEVAAATGGEALEDFARVSGMTAEGFKALWDSDPASAFQAFIVGLSKMDEEGASAIATLQEIGINEIRLRDTLLRATNATELFAGTQALANAAWAENSALTEEAGKRYATTESRLVNLKNKAVLFGQQIGDDLNPMIQSLIDGTGELLDKFLEMDEAQRMQVIRYAAIAASIGPVLLLMGKVSKGVGALSAGIGKFATAVGKAGGGWSGFLSVLTKSPAVWLAVAAAVVAGTVALVDYVSSAKQAREALEGMNETAKKWKDTAAMDEGAMTEYIAMLTQIQSLLDQGMTEDEIQAMFPEIDFTTALEQIASIQAFLNNRELELPGLTEMFGEALPEEVLTIATDLDMTGAQERWDTFAADPGAITTDAIIAQLKEDENTKRVQPQVDAFIAKYTEIAEGADTASLTPEGIIALVNAYAEETNGADVSGLTPQNVTAMVAAYEELASGVDISTLKPDEITAYISNYLEENNVDTSGLTPDGLTAFVLAYQEVTGGALTTALTPDGITAMVAKYLEAEEVDISALSPDQVEAVVSAFAEATGCDKSQLLQDFTAYIARYDDTNAQKPTLSVSVGIYGYDLMAYRKFIAENPVEVQGIVKLGEVYENPEEALLDPQTKFWQDGQQIPVEAVPTELLTADKVAVLDEDGTLHVLIAPDVTGAQEAIDSLRTEVAEVDQLGVTALGKAAGPLPETSLDMIESALSRLQSYQETLDYNWWDKFWAGVFGASTDKGTLDISMKLDFPAERVAELSTYVGEIVATIQQGQEVKQEDLDNLQTILTFLQELDTSEVGTHILEGVGEGMTAAGWDSDAETVASNLEAALNLALGIQSPSTRVRPVGANVSAGVGEGMKTYDFSSDASLLATAIEAAVTGALPATALEPTGTAAVQGLAKRFFAARSADPAGGAHVGSGRGRR